MDVDFEYEGEMPPELALEPARRGNFPFMRLSGPANVLIMPAIHSASIATKLVQSLGGATVLGPVLLGLSRSVQIAPLSASVSQHDAVRGRVADAGEQVAGGLLGDRDLDVDLVGRTGDRRRFDVHVVEIAEPAARRICRVEITRKTKNDNCRQSHLRQPGTRRGV